MKIVLMLFLLAQTSFAQTLRVQWNDHFVKELGITCSTEAHFCELLCGALSSCLVVEQTCRSCIGTGQQMHRLLSELGQSIQPVTGPVALETIIRFIRGGNFSTLTPRDVYNVIDGFGALNVFKKFESLCPGESEEQIIFLEVNGLTRKVIGPKYVYCQYFEESVFFMLDQRPKIEKPFPSPAYLSSKMY